MGTLDFTGPGTLDFTRPPQKAPSVSYTPTMPLDWSPSPTTVQGALDELAASGGGGGTPPAEDVFEYDFTFETESPADFGSLVPGATILDSDVIITVPFNDPAAIVTLGQASDTGNILNSAEIDPTQIGTYNSSADYLISAPDLLRVQVVPGTSTQGAGRVVVQVRRP